MSRHNDNVPRSLSRGEEEATTLSMSEPLSSTHERSFMASTTDLNTSSSIDMSAPASTNGIATSMASTGTTTTDSIVEFMHAEEASTVEFVSSAAAHDNDPNSTVTNDTDASMTTATTAAHDRPSSQASQTNSGDKNTMEPSIEPATDANFYKRTQGVVYTPPSHDGSSQGQPSSLSEKEHENGDSILPDSTAASASTATTNVGKDVEADASVDTAPSTTTPVAAATTTSPSMAAVAATATEYSPGFAEARIVPGDTDGNHVPRGATFSLPLRHVQAEDTMPAVMRHEETRSSDDVDQHEHDPKRTPNSGAFQRVGRHGRWGIIALFVILVLIALWLLWQFGPTPGTDVQPSLSATSSPTASQPVTPAITTLSDQVVAYIRSVTLTNQSFSHFSPIRTHEEEALEALFVNNKYLEPPDTPHAQFRWRQRYALATLLPRAAASFQNHEDECSWIGVACETIALDTNGSSSSSTAEATSFSAVIGINLALNNIVGTLSPDLGLLSSLQVFNLRDNALDGSVPLSLAQWTNLTVFLVPWNNLKGTIPFALSQWKHIELFDMYDNALTGPLPDFLGQLTTMKEFSVGDNEITGTLPLSIAAWSNIELFHVWDNALTGILPAFLEGWTNLRLLDVASNELDGSLPDFIGQWTNLRSFAVGDNRLVGTLPTSIQRWTSITLFDISENSFSGTIPESIAHWKTDRFEIFSNLLIGKLPAGIGNWTNMRIFNTGHNDLTGSLPTAMAAWTKLEYFDVQNNKFTGTLTDDLVQNWSHIREAHFFWNNFTGVPAIICNAVNLTSMAADCTAEDQCTCCNCYSST